MRRAWFSLSLFLWNAVLAVASARRGDAWWASAGAFVAGSALVMAVVEWGEQQ